MVNYLPTVSNEISITITSVNVATSLVLTGPSTAAQGVAFTLSATLKRDDTSAPIPDATINFYLGSTLLGSAVTNSSGVATRNVSMEGTGTYRFTAHFDGMTVAGLTYLPSNGLWTVGETKIWPILAVLGAAYLVLKK